MFSLPEHIRLTFMSIGVEIATHGVLDYEIAGKTRSAEVRLEPVHKIQILILRHSDHDLGYTDLQRMSKQTSAFLGSMELELKVGQRASGET